LGSKGVVEILNNLQGDGGTNPSPESAEHRRLPALTAEKIDKFARGRKGEKLLRGVTGMGRCGVLKALERLPDLEGGNRGTDINALGRRRFYGKSAQKKKLFLPRGGTRHLLFNIRADERGIPWKIRSRMLPRSLLERAHYQNFVPYKEKVECILSELKKGRKSIREDRAHGRRNGGTRKPTKVYSQTTQGERFEVELG